MPGKFTIHYPLNNCFYSKMKGGGTTCTTFFWIYSLWRTNICRAVSIVLGNFGVAFDF